MRAFLFAALLAVVAAPAFAVQDQDRSGRHHGLTVRNATRMETPSETRSERSSAERPRPQPQRSVGAPTQVNRPQSIDRARAMEVRREAPLATAADRAERLQGREAVRRSDEIQRNVQVDRPQRSFEPRVVRAPGTNAEVTGARRSGGSIPGARTRESRRSVGTATIEERNLRRAPGVREPSNRDLVQQRREAPRVFEPAQRRISRTPVLGTEPPAPRTAAQRIARPERSWRTDWRKDHRYNWHDWRRRHRSHFHLGLYYDPYGWDYFRYGVGWRLWPSYYRSSYWLNDPWQYRLPPAYGPYRWVRYHYDAVLVNIYTGEVVDIVYNFFW